MKKKKKKKRVLVEKNLYLELCFAEDWLDGTSSKCDQCILPSHYFSYVGIDVMQ